MWFHYIDKKSFKSILKEGFKISNKYGRFGQAVYFTNTEEYGFFGDYKIEVDKENSHTRCFSCELEF